MEKIKLGWYKITKSFQGGMHEFAFEVTKEIQENFSDCETLLEHIGKHTDGGHNYGYKIYARHCKGKPKIKNTLTYGEVIIKDVKLQK